MNLPSNRPYLYEINKNVIEEFTVPALLIDLNMNVVAKNLRARRYLRTLRLGNTVKGVISEGDVEDMQRMKIGDRMRISMLVVGDMFGGIVQRCYDCYAVKVMTSNSALVKRLIQVQPDLSEKSLLEYFDFGEALRDDLDFRSAMERLFAKREKYVVKLSWQVGQFLRVSHGLNRVYYDASNLNMLVREVERNIVKVAPMIASRFACAYRTQNCWALLDKRDFQSALMLMIEFAYTYMAGRVVNVDLSETVNTFFLCVNFDCALPRPLIEAMCGNDFEDPAFGKKYGDVFFPRAARNEKKERKQRGYPPRTSVRPTPQKAALGVRRSAGRPAGPTGWGGSFFIREYRDRRRAGRRTASRGSAAPSASAAAAGGRGRSRARTAPP